MVNFSKFTIDFVHFFTEITQPINIIEYIHWFQTRLAVRTFTLRHIETVRGRFDVPAPLLIR